MITAQDCLLKYGKPELEKHMVLWDVPAELEIGVLPNRIYCNKDMVQPLTLAFRNIVERGLVEEVKTWNGCFCIRKKVNATSQSLHSWGIAIDINAAENGYGKTPTMSKELINCFKDTGYFVWGGEWHPHADGMHFQLAKLP